MSGDVDDVVLLDVMPLTLGIETLGGVSTQLIEANTTIPTSKTETFSTAADNQTSVEIHVLQGERAKAQDNRTLGRFHLDGIPPAPRGVPQIEVSFDMDANGVLNVSAKDKGTGKEQSIHIESSSGLSEEEIDKMKDAAEEHAEEDEKIRERQGKLNEADSLVFSTRKQLDEHGDKIGDDQKTKIEDAVEKVEELKEGEDMDALDDAVSHLNEVWSEASQEIYKSAQQEAQAQQQQPGDGQQAGAQASQEDESEEEEDAVDADFEVVDEDEEKE
jgi:molecular chaperone DnaK